MENKFLPSVEEARTKAMEESGARKRLEILIKEIGQKVAQHKVCEMTDQEVNLWAEFFCIKDKSIKLNRRKE